MNPFGPPDSAKPQPLSGIGDALIDTSKRVLFVRSSDLVQRLRAARLDLRVPARTDQDRLSRPANTRRPGYARPDQAETPVLLELIAERNERKSIAITANTPFSQRGDVFVDPGMTLTAIDSLVHRATILEMKRRELPPADAEQEPRSTIKVR